MHETKTRSITKTVAWRIVATLNSFLVLVFFSNILTSNLGKAIMMNITGFFIYYIYERIWNMIKWGKE
jgi:uncharacterized membrane protein|tara:strand:- start:878 stop:1081 length:204 start_codon:yes stop_codon:yes gene_type:complete